MQRRDLLQEQDEGEQEEAERRGRQDLRMMYRSISVGRSPRAGTGRS